MDGVDPPLEVPRARLWRASSGWGGPFQYEDVLVVAPDLDAARHYAERAFGEVTQPVCRARMRLYDLGPVVEGVIAGPRRGGEEFGPTALETGVRCDDPTA